MFLVIGSGRKTMSNFNRLCLCTCLSVMLATGCATSGDQAPVETVAESRIPGDVEHIIVAGDRLGDIALRYTGQAFRWQEIARHNQIEDPRSLRIGDVIVIPGSMLRESLRGPENGELSGISNTSGTTSTATTMSTASLALQRESTPASESQDVTIAPVTANRRFELEPITTPTPENRPDDAALPAQVRVVGTYYPKGVYQQPASYSRLMMRVAPGTIFELDSEMSDWYRVVTSQGVGYLRQIDGKVIPASTP